MKKVISTVLGAFILSGAMLSAQAGHHGKSFKMQQKNIVETAAAAGQFETLIAAAKAAGLAGALTGEGPLTVFAPTDEAFGALPAGTIDTLLMPENKDQLARILKFHVISGEVTGAALADGVAVDTLAGASAIVTKAEQGFTINGARIVATDIAASNGVVHVIDRVIMPPEQMTRAQARMLIDAAIDRGVPAFNHGNPEMTVDIYAATARKLTASAELSHGDRMSLSKALRGSEHANSDRASAWMLRYALDDVRTSLKDDTIMSNDR